MTTVQKKVFWLVLGIGVLYFALFAAPNLVGAKSEQMLGATSVDEPVTYTYVVRMLTPAKDLKDLFSRWVIYGDYHYGYPFYFFSALVILPVRLIHGALFTNFTSLNLFLLRQLISVLPMLAAVILLVFMQTRFRSIWSAVGLLVVLLTTRALVRNNIQWWHPDALSILSVVLVLFFLQRDNLRFGKNFYFAAAACGLAVGIKLAGAFFILTIPTYLLAGVLQKSLSLPRAAVAAGLFCAAALAVLIVSNPFLYNSGARQELVKIQSFKTVELDQGYSQDAPQYYTKGPSWWTWTLSTWYGGLPFLAFITISLLVGCLWGPERLLNCLILTWVLPYSIYLLFFVAVKPDHYWLPILVPAFSAALTIPLAVKNKLIPWVIGHLRMSQALTGLTLLALLIQLSFNVARPYSGLAAQYSRGLNVEHSQTK